MNILDESMIYQVTDEDILRELRRRLVRMRKSCRFSQHELSDLSGVPIATIKHIESPVSRDLSLLTVVRLLRTMTLLEGVDGFVPDVPESPFIIKKQRGVVNRV